jgi:hypothetical protein
MILMEKKYSAHHRASASKSRAANSESRSAVIAEAMRLFVCMVILAFAVAIKLLFPDFAAAKGQQLKQAVCGDADYQSAIEAVGASLSGGDNIIEAFSQGYKIAFSDDVE